MIYPQVINRLPTRNSQIIWAVETPQAFAVVVIRLNALKLLTENLCTTTTIFKYLLYFNLDKYQIYITIIRKESKCKTY